MATPGQRPGTEVEQEFVTPSPILEDPTQPVVIIGIAKQLEVDLDAGVYDGSAFVDFYPSLKLNAVVDLATVAVSIQNSFGVFAIPAGSVNNLPPVADKFDIDAAVTVDRDLTTGTTASMAGTAVVTDLNQKFITAGALPGDKLEMLSGTLGPSTIVNLVSVTSQTAVVTDYAGPAVNEGNIQYRLFRTEPALGTVLITYEATRVDLNDVLTRITDDDSIPSLVGPIDPRNPAGFAVDKARLNAGEQQVFFTGVSADTVLEHTRALEFLESENGYGLAPLSQDTAVLQLYEPHVDTSSLPENKRERVAYLNRQLLLRETKISTADARTGIFTDSTGIFTDDAGGVFKFSDFVTTGDFIIFDDAGTIRELLIQQVGPATVPLLTEDQVLINVPGSVNHPGANLATGPYTALSETKAKTEQAQFIGDYAQTFGNRRIVLVWPDQVEVSFNSALQLVPGYFLAAAIGGLRSGQRPQQPLTNLSVAGFTGLRNSNRYFNESQLKILSANGVFVVEQAVETASPFIRQQRTTDITTIKKNELSVTTTVDFVAQLFRQELDPYTGRYNITPQLIDTLKVVVDGLFSRLLAPTDIGPVILSGKLISIEQDEVELDVLNIEVDIEVPIPANFIRVRIQV